MRFYQTILIGLVYKPLQMSRGFLQLSWMVWRVCQIVKDHTKFSCCSGLEKPFKAKLFMQSNSRRQ